MALSDMLPENFTELLRKGDMGQLQAIFDECALDARGGPFGQTALGFPDCPDELITWLVGQGLDPDSPGQQDATPLRMKARFGPARQIPLLLSLGAELEAGQGQLGTALDAAAWYQQPDAVRALLEAGANPHALTRGGDTPLETGMSRAALRTMPHMSQVAELLIDAGAEVTGKVRRLVEYHGKDFERRRPDLTPEIQESAQSGLQELYRLCSVTPAEPITRHDGRSPIQVPEGPWGAQHDALWDLLVPSAGSAATVQGEVIRITGRIAYEMHVNGAANWDHDYQTMLETLTHHLTSGKGLRWREARELRRLSRTIRDGKANEGQTNRLSELAVWWVSQNSIPVPLPPPTYAR